MNTFVGHVHLLVYSICMACRTSTSTNVSSTTSKSVVKQLFPVHKHKVSSKSFQCDFYFCNKHDLAKFMQPAVDSRPTKKYY